MNDKTAKKLSTKAEGCTNTTEYECPCGKGKIVYVQEIGFSDFYASIECEVCQKEYDLKLACGYRWELIKK